MRYFIYDLIRAYLDDIYYIHTIIVSSELLKQREDMLKDSKKNLNELKSATNPITRNLDVKLN